MTWPENKSFRIFAKHGARQHTYLELHSGGNNRKLRLKFPFSRSVLHVVVTMDNCQLVSYLNSVSKCGVAKKRHQSMLSMCFVLEAIHQAREIPCSMQTHHSINSRQVVDWYRLIAMSPPHVDAASPAQGVLQVPSPWRSKSVFVSRSVISQPAHQHLR